MVNLNKIVEFNLDYENKIYSMEKFIFEDGYTNDEIISHILNIAPRYVFSYIPPEKLIIIILIDGAPYYYGANDVSEYRNIPYVKHKQPDNEISLGGNYYDVLANKDEVVYKIDHIVVTRNRVEISEELSKYLIEFFKNKVMSNNNAISSFVEFNMYKSPENYFMQYDSYDNYFWFEKVR